MVRLRWCLLGLCAAGGIAACGGSGGGGGGGGGGDNGPPPPEVTSFNDVTLSSSIDFAVGITRPSALPAGPQSDIDHSTFGGIASGDCDLDGDIDLFVTRGDAGPNRLYLNQFDSGNGLRFVDNASAANVAYSRSESMQQNDRHSGPAFADMDGDGDLDLFMGGLYGDPIKLYRNEGDCTFVDVTSNSPELEAINARPAEYYTFSAGFGDYDLDGDLDMFLSHWGTPDAISGQNAGYSEHLWENKLEDGEGIKFVNASASSGVAEITYKARGFSIVQGPINEHPGFKEYDYTFLGTFAHLNDDEWPDLLIVGDFSTSQILINNGDGTFSDGSVIGLRNAQQPMGSALGDYDNDGDLDWFTSSVQGYFSQAAQAWGNRFFRNDGPASGTISMTDITDAMGVRDGGWGWAACFLDIDNDTDLDIYHTNGWWAAPGLEGDYTTDRSRLFLNIGTSYAERANFFGLGDSYSGRAAVCADFDEDGDVDILQLTDKQPNSAALYENQTAASSNNYLRVRLKGLAPNTEAAGARIYVTITDGGTTQMREVMIGANNYTSQNPAVQIFGLGSASVVHEVRVVWPARMPGPVQPDDWVQNTVQANTTLEPEQLP